jgi:Ni2+-binding GTPase involved in maturation of urease and hydrogenase
VMAWGRRRRSRDDRPVAAPRVAVVGPCASGKTTLVDALRNAGVDAHVVAQEHSGVPDLWRHAPSDLLISLELDLETLRARRGAEWPETVFRDQIARLERAQASADLRIDTGRMDAAATLAEALAAVERWRRGRARRVS